MRRAASELPSQESGGGLADGLAHPSGPRGRGVQPEQLDLHALALRLEHEVRAMDRRSRSRRLPLACGEVRSEVGAGDLAGWPPERVATARCLVAGRAADVGAHEERPVARHQLATEHWLE